MSLSSFGQEGTHYLLHPQYFVIKSNCTNFCHDPSTPKSCRYLSCTSGYIKSIVLPIYCQRICEVQWCNMTCVWQNLNSIAMYITNNGMVWVYGVLLDHCRVQPCQLWRNLRDAGLLIRIAYVTAIYMNLRDTCSSILLLMYCLFF